MPHATPDKHSTILIGTGYQDLRNQASKMLGPLQEPIPAIPQSTLVTSQDDTANVLVSLAPSDPKPHTPMIKATALMMVLIHMYDVSGGTATTLVDQARRIVEINPEIELLIIFGSNIPIMSREKILLAFLIYFSNPFMVNAPINADGTAGALRVIMNHGKDLAGVANLKRVRPEPLAIVGSRTSTGVPVFGSHPNYDHLIRSGPLGAPLPPSTPAPSGPSLPPPPPPALSGSLVPRSTTEVDQIKPEDRERCRRRLLAFSERGTEELIELEQRIYEASVNDISCYFETMMSETIRLELLRKTPMTSNECKLGKRANHPTDVKIAPKRSRLEAPDPTKQLYTWIVKRREETSYLFPPEAEPYAYRPVCPATARVLEARYRDPTKRAVSFLVQLFPEDASESHVDLGQMTVNWIPNSLERRILFSGQLLDMPVDWVPQDEEVHMYMLDPESYLYQEVTELFFGGLLDVERDWVKELTVQAIQSIPQLMTNGYAAGMVEVSLPVGTDLEERALFFGSQTLPPLMIAQEGMPTTCDPHDTNRNWGRCPHLSECSWYSNRSAYCYINPDDGMPHRQVMLVDAQIGRCKEEQPTPLIRRAPQATTINHMPIQYHSIKGTYHDTSAGIDTTIYAIHGGKDLMLPCYILDYQICAPSAPPAIDQ